MERKIASGTMFTLLLIGMLALTCNTERVKAEPSIIVVPDDFPTIQEAINNADSGDTVYVKPGIYRENLVINKAISLIGDNKENTVIDGSQSIGYAVRIDGTYGTTITRFTIQNAPNCGVRTYLSSRANISDNIFSRNNEGIWIFRSQSTTVTNNLIKSSNYGIAVEQSQSTTIADNLIKSNNVFGILHTYSDYSIITDNMVTNNTGTGIIVAHSRFATLRNNNMTENAHNFGVSSFPEYVGLYGFIHGIDTTNTVNGKPIYYLVNRQNEQIPYDAGYVAIVNSTNIVVRDLNLTNNWQAVILAYSRYSIIRNVRAKNMTRALDIVCSSFNNLSDNTLSRNQYGVVLDTSTNTTVECNELSNNENSGIFLRNSIGTRVVENSIEENRIGISLTDGSNSVVYHNNFVNNVQQTFLYSVGAHTYAWDDGYPSGGNYWSDHVKVDCYSGVNQDEPGSDRIVDEPYIIDADNRDNYPLAQPWSPTISATVDIDPDTLNLRNEGQWITAYIQLPEGYNPEDIDATTILLNDTVSPVLDPKYDFAANSSEYLVDHNKDGILERMIKFDRAAVQSFIYDLGIRNDDVAMALAGKLFDDTSFEGTDTITVVTNAPFKR